MFYRLFFKSKQMKYNTHAGFFHCDEIAGFAICRLAKVATELERLTDMSNLPIGEIVADIGRIDDPSQLRFDHHQEFILREDGFPYASAGLLWKEYGRKAITECIGDHKSLDDIWKRVDEKLIKGIDAFDSDSDYTLKGNCVAGEVNIQSLSNIVSMYNTKDLKDHSEQKKSFLLAADLISMVLESTIKSAKKQIEDSERFDSIVEIKEGYAILPEFLSWKEIVHERYPDLRFIILPSAHPTNTLSMIAVPINPQSRKLKLEIERPPWFKGFIHQGKWICGSDSKEELILLAECNLEVERYFTSGESGFKSHTGY